MDMLSSQLEHHCWVGGAPETALLPPPFPSLFTSVLSLQWKGTFHLTVLDGSPAKEHRCLNALVVLGPAGGNAPEKVQLVKYQEATEASFHSPRETSLKQALKY